MSTRSMTFIALLVFAVTLALVIGSNLPAEAMPIVLGVAIGVAVSVPTSALIAVASRQTVPSVAFETEADAGGSEKARRVRRKAAAEERPSRDFQRQFTIVGGAGPPVLEEDDFSGNGNHT